VIGCILTGFSSMPRASRTRRTEIERNPDWNRFMKRTNLHKTLIAAALIGGTIVGTSALADPVQVAYGLGYDMGPGMMGGDATGYFMGTGMTDGYLAGSDLNLTARQRDEIAKIQNSARQNYLDLKGKMQAEHLQMKEQYYSERRDDAALSKSYRNMSELRNQMFDLSLSAQKQMYAVLTDEQRDKLKRG
jgi:Spy/CpxP family protein refolding chaperone